MLLTKKNILSLMPTTHNDLMTYAPESRHVSRLNYLLDGLVGRGVITKHEHEREVNDREGKPMKLVTYSYSMTPTAEAAVA